MALEIDQFLIGADNIGVLVHDTETGSTATIDAGDALTITSRLDHHGWRLSDILVTHHHQDHIAGVIALKSATGARVVGARADQSRIPQVDVFVDEGDRVSVGGIGFEILDTPGHTRGHIAYYSSDAHVLFAGDTLFSLGCGRLFEGSAAEMWASLLKLRALPDSTLLYCGHEYTLSNARFALRIDPENRALAERAREVAAMRAEGRLTLPVPLCIEKNTNVFLRADDPAFQRVLGLTGRDAVDVFAALRSAKDKS